MAGVIELAWAAGFFEGEGSVMLDARGYFLSQILQCGDPYALHRFADAVGLGNVKGPYGPYGGSHAKNPHHKWTARDKDTRAVMALLDPYLSVGCVKRCKYQSLCKEV